MKKFLFTLASIALGFAAYANTEAVAFSAEEITLEGGQTQELTFSVVDKPYALINGVQWNFTMFDENGAILNNGCHLELLEAYGTRDAWAWFGLNMVQANGAVVNNGTAATSSNGTYHQTDTWDDEGDYMPDNDYGVEGVNVTYTGKYNVILANVGSNQIFTTRYQYPMQALKFTVKVEEGWEGNYAELRLVMREYSYSDGVVDRIENEDGIIVLKINNGSAVTPPVAPEAPVVTFVENGDVLTVTVTAEDDVVLTVNGVEVDSPYSYTVDRTYEAQTIEVHAVATRDELTATTDTTYTFAAKPLEDPITPQISFSEEEGVGLTITVTDATSYEVIVDGVNKGQITYVEAIYDQTQNVVVNAVNETANHQTGEATDNTTVKPKAYGTLAGEIVFSEVNQENGQFTVTYTGDEEVTLSLNNENITIVRGTTNTYQLPAYGTYEVTATAKAAHFNDKSEDATLVWNEPETPPTGEAPTVPQITIDMDDNTVTVGATEQDGATTTLYLVTGYDDDGNPILEELDNPTSFTRGTENQTVYVMAIAENDYGTAKSEVITIPVPAKEETPTGIDEMMNGKTIAGVRFFNMAGQEMSEVNGMTIIVTTYTDGTTSAVKVMK